MPAKANICVPLFKGGEKDVTVRVQTAAVVGKTFAQVSATFESGPEITTAVLPTTWDGGNLRAVTCPAAGRADGVFAYDAAVGVVLPLIRRGAGRVIAPVTCNGVVAVNAEVEVGANGRAITLATGVAVGKARTAGTAGTDAYIELY